MSMDSITMKQLGSILTNMLQQVRLSTRMVTHKFLNVMNNNTINEQAPTILNTYCELFQAQHRKFINRNTPRNPLTLEFQSSLNFLELTLLNLIHQKPLQVRSKTHLLTEPDDPLRWVPLKPPDSIGIVNRGLMVEVMISSP
ncbi:uncharacterized protein N7498_008698 [Penicillium cinerascens]|uniref:Uncharacterized protein n=1 Tax=Penicillium cinerascens TaxID=70096 RepID=A0A9W9JE84_9EURO|nr:uncharacterized protein N7498_008698 [Penicillium cinerascens]KAJ5195260.1 hypothetical protein N7498_008698 [Penicillium cinerascens]